MFNNYFYWLSGSLLEAIKVRQDKRQLRSYVELNYRVLKYASDGPRAITSQANSQQVTADRVMVTGETKAVGKVIVKPRWHTHGGLLKHTH